MKIKNKIPPKRQTLIELLEDDYKQISIVPSMFAKETTPKIITIYQLQFSKVGGDIFKQVYYGERKYVERMLGWAEWNHLNHFY